MWISKSWLRFLKKKFYLVWIRKKTPKIKFQFSSGKPTFCWNLGVCGYLRSLQSTENVSYKYLVICLTTIPHNDNCTYVQLSLWGIHLIISSLSAAIFWANPFAWSICFQPFSLFTQGVYLIFEALISKLAGFYTSALQRRSFPILEIDNSRIFVGTY